MAHTLTPKLLDSLISVRKSFNNLQYPDFFQGEGKILNFLFLTPNGCASPTQISNSLDFSTPRVAAALNNLQKKQMITRQKSPTDGRATTILLTEKGQEWISQKRDMVYQITDSLILKIGEQDTNTLIAILEKIADTGECENE